MKDIKGFEGKYAVTEDGRVWSHITNKWLSLRGSGKMNKIRIRKRGYRTVALIDGKPGKYAYFYVHRLVAQHFIPNPFGYKTVNHKDGDQMNNRVENLEWCSLQYNLKHSKESGLTHRGELSGMSKLTSESVIAIRRKHATGAFSYRQLGDEYGVTSGCIGSIIKRKTWNWLD